MAREAAIVKIQALARRKIARRKVRELARSVWEKVQDPTTGCWFYYNTRTGESTWFKPALLGEAEPATVE